MGRVHHHACLRLSSETLVFPSGSSGDLQAKAAWATVLTVHSLSVWAADCLTRQQSRPHPPRGTPKPRKRPRVPERQPFLPDFLYDPRHFQQSLTYPDAAASSRPSLTPCILPKPVAGVACAELASSHRRESWPRAAIAPHSPTGARVKLPGNGCLSCVTWSPSVGGLV